ncbi:hypothetical protein M404DRAFT_34523 [Pisolithus tinctorius Marx 270]|uniref:Uncharacterized protein n=1 Tax=Pisolithus tinctorius Marx 270 TaxID=870435 RepID=A0A0C3JBF6_PISTI|nr:hypothetical protein M404DRAFT_34523 [Pisolithus tinctorius Marx 270]
MKVESKKQACVTQRAEHAKALLEAKKQGEGAYKAMKLKIAQDKLKVAEAKKQEKLQIAAAKQAEKAKTTAAKKAKGAQARLTRKHKAIHEEQLSHPLSMQANEEESLGANTFTDEDDGKFSLHPNDLDNCLKLCSALCILLRQRLTDDDIVHAEQLISEYGTELIMLYGTGAIKPNHHYATHIGDCVRNFRPLHDFWTFLFEQLNKILKSFRTNNHANGELKTTFFEEFHQMSEVARLTFRLHSYPEESIPSQATQIMLKASNDEHGTVAGLALLTEEIELTSVDGISLHY